MCWSCILSSFRHKTWFEEWFMPAHVCAQISSHKILSKCIYFSLKTAQHRSDPVPSGAFGGKKFILKIDSQISALSLRYGMTQNWVFLQLFGTQQPMHRSTMISIYVYRAPRFASMMQNLCREWIKCQTRCDIFASPFSPLASCNDLWRSGKKAEPGSSRRKLHYTIESMLS